MGSNRYPLGVSSYGDNTPTSTRGKMQYLTSEYVALQVRSAAVEFDRDVLHNNGEHLTPNEGIREYDRQEDLYDLYLHHGGALAAVPGYSTHDPSIGTAIDFGITRADGSNRALTDAEFSALYAILARRGIAHTGANFARYEAWHCNGGYPASLPPITGVPLMGEDPASTPTEDEPRDIPVPREADDMKVMEADGFWFAKDGPRLWKIDDVKVNGKTYPGSTVRVILQTVERSTPEEPAKLSLTQFNVLRAALKRFK